jgi:5-methylcytosine-specific restriction endonuclease McrA
MNRTDLGRWSAGELTSRLYALRAAERKLIVEFLGYLGELDARKIYLELGFSSTFAFCTDHLGLSKSSAYRRTTAARLMVRFPLVAEYLEDGRLGLTTLVELRDALDAETVLSVLDRAAGRTEDEVKVLAAALRPQPAPPDLLRRLPRASAVSATTPQLMLAVPVPEVGSGPEPQIPVLPVLPVPIRPAKLEPISETQHVLRVTVPQAFVDDLEAVRDALSHVIPDRQLEKVLHECIRRTLEQHVRRRTGSDKTAETKAEKIDRKAPPRGRYLPVQVRRQVWRRDEGRCAFVSADGRRCGATYKLEFHHVHPYAKGGAATVENISVRCAMHNGFHAVMDFASEELPGSAAVRTE